MPEKHHRDDDTRRGDEASEQRPEPVPSAPSSAPPSAPDSKRERQMTDFPDGD